MEASTLLSLPGMSISIVTKLQLEFHVDLVKKFCAIGGFEDLAAPVSWSDPDESARAERQVLYFHLQE